MLHEERPAIGRAASQPTEDLLSPIGKPATHSGTAGLPEVAGYAATFPFPVPDPSLRAWERLPDGPPFPAALRARLDAVSSGALDTLLALRGHVNIAHHVRGRIRLRIAPTLVRSTTRVDREQIEQALRAIEGIGAVRVNPAAGSVVVEYAPDRIPPDTWVALLKGDPEEARIRLRSLLGSNPEPVASDPEAAKSQHPSDKERT